MLNIKKLLLCTAALSGILAFPINDAAVHAEENTETEMYKDYTLSDKVPVYSDIIPESALHRPGVDMKIKTITIHNTANSQSSADARMHSEYLKGNKSGAVSWHFTVDENEIINHVPVGEVAYHAGDWNGEGNMNSVGIEICENEGADYRKAEANAETLTAILLYENGLNIENVVPHQCWTGKHCPHLLLDKENGSVGWDQFLKNVSDKLTAIKAQKNTALNTEETIAVTEKLSQPLKIQSGQTDTLSLYQPAVRPEYIISDNDEAVPEKSSWQSEQSLNAHSNLTYSQAVKLKEADYEIKDVKKEFERLLNSDNAFFTSDADFFNSAAHSFNSEGTSAIKVVSDKGSAEFIVCNFLDNGAVITTNEEANSNSWNLDKPSLDLTTVMSGASQKEFKRKAEAESGSITDTASLIDIMNGKLSKPAEDDAEKTAEENEDILKFVSSNDSVAAITQEGRLFAVSKGTAVISVKVGDITVSRVCEVS